MQIYRNELLQAAAAVAAAKDVPEADAKGDDTCSTELPTMTPMTEEEKNAAIREELAQLRANVLAKKKRQKKKV
jgi:hypothetical protein